MKKFNINDFIIDDVFTLIDKKIKKEAKKQKKPMNNMVKGNENINDTEGPIVITIGE